MEDEKISDEGETRPPVLPTPVGTDGAIEEGGFELSLLVLRQANPDAPEDDDEVAPPAVPVA